MTKTAATLSKVPEVTLAFWLIKIAATTLGETGGDTVTMTMHWGYLAGTALFLGALVVLVGLADRRRANSIRSSIGRPSSPPPPSAPPWRISPTARSASAMPAVDGAVARASSAVLALWYWSQGTISVDDGERRRRSRCSTGRRSRSRRRSAPRSATGRPTRPGSATNTARWCSPPASPWSPALYFWTGISRVTLFWIAFILTRPLGATVGDFLDKPVRHGGLALSRPVASAVIAASSSWPVPAGPAATRRQASRTIARDRLSASLPSNPAGAVRPC